MPDFDQIADQQGWNSDSIISILRSFVTADGGDQRLNEYAQDLANEENA